MIRQTHPIAQLLVWLLIFAAVVPFATRADNSAVTTQTDSEDTEKGLTFRLSESPDQPEAKPAPSVAAMSYLPENELAGLLNRLPALPSVPTDAEDFAVRENSLPPPRTGITVSETFPSSTNATPVNESKGPFEVVRFSPAGDVPLAERLSVTFSQPMVAVTSQAAAAENVPAKLSPQPGGRWRWLGTKTLVFESDKRLPMATHYSVNIPVETTSANGTKIKTGKAWTFRTPPPKVTQSFPSSDATVERNQLMFVEFDQRIDPVAVLEHIKVTSRTGVVPVRLASADEIKTNKELVETVQRAEKDRWLAFRAVDASGNTDNALPNASRINVVIGAGTPSAEGPLTTIKPQTFSFRTYGPLRVTSHECSGDRPCAPGGTWFIYFSHDLAASLFQKSQIKIEPEIPNLKTSVYASQIQLEGGTHPRSLYRVKLDPSIKDKFGQTLGPTLPITFPVGSAPRALYGLSSEFTVLDPVGPPQISVYSMNYQRLRVKLYQTQASDWPNWLNYRRAQRKFESKAARPRVPPGRLVFDKIVQVKSRADELAETKIDLAPACQDGLGQMILQIEPPQARAAEDDRLESWMQRTNIGLDAFVDRSDLLGWTNSLTDGAPLAGVELEIVPSRIKATTDQKGLARLGLQRDSERKQYFLVARKGADVAILPQYTNSWEDSGDWFRKDETDSLRWYVFDDRKLYRPGEEVQIKGWVRRVTSGPNGDVELLGNLAAGLIFTVVDSKGNQIANAGTKVNALGGFNTSIKLPATINLGVASVHLHAGTLLDGADYQHQFRVEEFRRPEFEVNCTVDSEGPHFFGSNARVTVAAAYFAGGGLQNADVRWNVTATPGSFTPPNRGDWTFGKWTPWWVQWSYDPEIYKQIRSQQFTGKTDAAGKHRLRIDFETANPVQPYSITAQSSVTDVNRQGFFTTTSFLVHPANLYVGLKSERTFVQQGEPLMVQSIVTDLDGKAVAGREVQMRAARLEWQQEGGDWKEKEVESQDCTVKSASDGVPCRFETKHGGKFRVAAIVRDDRERRNESELTLWVAGGQQPPAHDVEQQTLELIPDRKEYRSGETAEILVQAPFYPAEGLVSLRRSGILQTERIQVSSSTYVVKVPIEEGYTPNVLVQVDLVGSAERSGSKTRRPAFASGTLDLSIPPLTRQLSVTATPQSKTLEPGAETSVEVQVKDASGQPASGSEVAVAVVDESVLALTDYKLDDPLSAFYVKRASETRDYHSRGSLTLNETDRSINDYRRGGRDRFQNYVTFSLAKTEVGLAGLSNRSGMFEMKRSPIETSIGALPTPPLAPPAEEQPIRLRENFNALAVFAPSVPTDSDGRARVQVKLPDNLTRYRVMAVAVAGGKKFGSGESSITARMPLMVRPSAPRFLNFGDRFELPIVLQNQTDQPLTVDVGVRATNLEVKEAGGRVTVPANGRVEVRFPAAAAKPGTARLQVAATSGSWADSAQVDLKVWTPATTESFATYGEIDQGAIGQPVKAPADAFKEFGGLEIETSSTQLQQLTDAVIYLMSYPYECSEQLSSRIITVAALKDVLAAFNAKDLPSPEAMQERVDGDLRRLQGMQNEDGGFGFWKRGDESWPFLSLHAAHAMARAKQKGFAVPEEMLKKSVNYLKSIEQHIPRRYSKESRSALIAYALYVRAQLGDPDQARARSLIATAGLNNLSLEAVGWLLPVLSSTHSPALSSVRSLLNNRVTETAGAAHFATSYTDGAEVLLHSNRRADGIILEGLIQDQPQSDLIPKLVRGLLANRVQGRWQNTQENVFILLALDRYFRTYEKTTPDFVARAWLGEKFAGERKFSGRETSFFKINVPMKYLGSEEHLVLNKEGSGRLYYRVALNYAPTNLNPEPVDYGFAVTRTYEAVDDPNDVKRNDDGSWTIRGGARVRVRLSMATPARRYHVALVDPLPAGFEALNPTLATTGSIPEDQKETGVAEYGSRAYGFGWWRWRAQWFDHQNLRDERAEAFTTLLWEGVYNYSYVARATTPGTFVVPPPKAEEMYMPETFGRGATDRVIVH
jgi:alpha-2-macroglobulin